MTPQAEYAAAHAELLTALEAHYTQVVAGDGMAETARRLGRALSAFGDAEYGWRGSLPFDEDDDEDDEDDDDEGLYVPGDTVTIEYRGALEVVDEAALVEQARAAYRRLWPDDPASVVEHRVTDAVSAVGELWHADGLPGVLASPHLHELQMMMDVRPGSFPAPDADH